jgi:ApeA N-terminal domain 1
MSDREGNHSGLFTLPDGRRAHGTLTLASNRPPQVSLHPDNPRPVGPEGRGFPRETEIDVLVGDLYSNEEVIVGDVHLSEWFPDQFLASGRWALIGLSITSVPETAWSRVQVRVTGLEVILGNAIAATWWPRTMDVDPQRFSADLNRDAVFECAADGVTVKVSYDHAFSAADPFKFSLTNYATATLVANAPLAVDDWVRGWIDPLVALITLATGERERMNTVTMSAPGPNPLDHGSRAVPEITAQLWGSGVHQRDQAAERRTRPDGSPLVPLFMLANAPPLVELVRRWHASIANETAASLYRLAIDRTLPAQVRYLLNAQALESLDSGTQAEAEAAEDTVHAERRGAVLEAINALDNEHLDPAAKAFLQQNLTRRPHRSLAGRLSRLMRCVPLHETRVRNWTKQTEVLAQELNAIGRISTPLHERLASARNALSHGVGLTPHAVAPANRILELLLRGQLLERLGFDDDQLADAYDRVDREQ